MKVWHCECGISGVAVPGSERLPLQCSCGRIYPTLPIDETQSPIPPRIVRRGRNYALAWARWSASGFPSREDDVVASLRLICEGCKFFDGSICTHQKCGCKVSGASWFGDKLKWSTEHCPIGKW